ncbi:MAG: hypothetical protein WBC51_05020 [Vicinamibacterales bacterium]
MPEVTLTRKELYTLVWSESLFKLSKRFDLSDVGLRKLCERHRVPVPWRGYWAQKAASQRVFPAPLIDAPGLRDQKIVLQERQPNAAAAESAPLPPEIAFERDPANLIVVEGQKPIAHPLVRRRAEEFRRSDAASDRDVFYKGRRCISIGVSRCLRSRALRIFEALIYALEARGYAIAVNDARA